MALFIERDNWEELQEFFDHQGKPEKRRPKKFRDLKKTPDDIRQYPESGPHHLGLAEWGWQAVQPSQGPRRDHKSRYG